MYMSGVMPSRGGCVGGGGGGYSCWEFVKFTCSEIATDWGPKHAKNSY